METTTSPSSSSAAVTEEPSSTTATTAASETSSGSSSSSSSSWLGDWWSSASNAVTAAAATVTNTVQHPESLREALVDAGTKAAERASSVAALVEQKGYHLATAVLDTLDPIADTVRLLDAVDLNAQSPNKVKVVVTSTGVSEFDAVVNTFQELYGDEAYIRGCTSESNVAAQPVGFEAALQGARNRIDSLLHASLLGTAAKKILVVSTEDFIVNIGETWFASVVVMMCNVDTGKRVHAFGQLIPVPKRMVDALLEACPKDYPHRSTGINAAIQEEVVRKYRASASEGGKDFESIMTNGTLDRVTNLMQTLALLVQPKRTIVHSAAADSSEPLAHQQ